MPTRKLLGIVAVIAAIVGGGVVGALVAIPAASNAQETTTSTTQADERRDDGHDGERHRPFRFFPGRRGVGLVDLEVAADALGISEDELRDSLRDGDSIADVAEERDVDLDKVIDALVADATNDVDDAVARFKENLPERMADVVNNEGGFCGGRLGLHLDRGDHDKRGD